jgi:hypothetical protein
MKSPVNGAGNGAIVPASVQLFDLVSGNVMAAFASEGEALNAIRDSAAEDSVESIENLSLMFIRDGHPTLIAMEEDLVHRALGNDEISGRTEVGAKRSRLAS